MSGTLDDINAQGRTNQGTLDCRETYDGYDWGRQRELSSIIHVHLTHRELPRQTDRKHYRDARIAIRKTVS